MAAQVYVESKSIQASQDMKKHVVGQSPIAATGRHVGPPPIVTRQNQKTSARPICGTVPFLNSMIQETSARLVARLDYLPAAAESCGSGGIR